MKEPRNSLHTVLERGTKFRASPHLHLPSRISHKPQVISKLYSLIYTLSVLWKILTSSWVKSIWNNPLGLSLCSSSYSLDYSSSHSKAKTHHILISPLLWTENSYSEHNCTVDIFQSDEIWPVTRQLPPSPDEYLSSVREWNVISKLT